MSENIVRRPAWHWLADFLVDQRVPISFVIFSTLIVRDVVFGTRPREVTDVSDPFAMLGLALVLCGLGMRSWAAGVIRKGKALATTGPYRLCRHPLYVGSLSMMAGFCLLVADVQNAWIIVASVLVIYTLTMRREELRLASRHGQAWTDYTRLAGRLFPVRFPSSLRSEWSLAQWLQNREYNALLATLMALVGLQAWRYLL